MSANARDEANAAAAQAKADLETSIARRLAAAADQIQAAEASAVKEVRDRAITIAVEVADQVVSKQMTATEANKLIDAAIQGRGRETALIRSFVSDLKGTRPRAGFFCFGWVAL